MFILIYKDPPIGRQRGTDYYTPEVKKQNLIRLVKGEMNGIAALDKSPDSAIKQIWSQ